MSIAHDSYGKHISGGKYKYTDEDWDKALADMTSYCDERNCLECHRKESCEKYLREPLAKAKE